MNSIFNHMKLVSNGNGGFNYVITREVKYFSERYNKHIIAKVGDAFDGATGAIDIDSEGWIIHDVLCRDGTFSDGTLCNNWQASRVLSDILIRDKRPIRSITWFIATWLIGGGKARDNGLF